MGIYRKRSPKKTAFQIMVQSLLMLLIGAFVTAWVAWLFRRRESRQTLYLKDLKDKIDLIFEDLKSVEDISIDYFLKSGADLSAAQDALKIKTKIRRIGLLVNSVCRDIKSSSSYFNSNILTKLKNFRQSITLDDFDSVDRVALLRSDNRFVLISKCIGELQEALDSAYDLEKSRKFDFF